jgi:hypothetical protein
MVWLDLRSGKRQRVQGRAVEPEPRIFPFIGQIDARFSRGFDGKRRKDPPQVTRE